MSALIHIRNFVDSQPWMLPNRGYLEMYCGIIESKLSGQPNANADIFEWEPESMRTVNGVDVIPITGPIIPRATMFSKISGATSLDILSKQFAESRKNRDSVCTMLYFENAPGGSVQGIFEFSDQVHAAATDRTNTKPVIAMVEGLCCSAAYCIASQCEDIFASIGSELGSIGIIAKISSAERMALNSGIDSKVISSHELKATGSVPMTPNQEDMIRRKIAQYLTMFQETVMRGRGESISDIQALSTGETWLAADAVRLGLADEISTFDQVIKEKGFRQF